MLPYMPEIAPNENINLVAIKNFIKKRQRPEKDINIEKIVHQPDLNIDFLYCPNPGSFEGENINELEIKDELFKKIKYRYEQYDLIAQKVFKFQINPKKGFISYMRFNNYTYNIGYNEYPTRYEEISDSTINYSIIPKPIDSNESLDVIDINRNSYQELILSNKDLIINDDSESIIINLNQTKTESIENKDKKKLLVRANLSKGNKANLKKPNTPKIDNNEENININQQLRINDELKDNENEEIDFLAQFKENQKRPEKNEIVEYNNENNIKKSKLNALRSSTLTEGILDEDYNEGNE